MKIDLPQIGYSSAHIRYLSPHIRYGLPQIGYVWASNSLFFRVFSHHESLNQNK